MSFSLQRFALEPLPSSAVSTYSLNHNFLSSIFAKSLFELGLVSLSLAEHLRLDVCDCVFVIERERETADIGPLQSSLDICIHIMLGNFLRR